MTNDAVLLARQDALQAQATATLHDLDLFARIAPIGRPTQTGSSVLGVMVARDIDVTTLCPTLDLEPVFELGRRLAGHPRVRKVAFRNDTGHWNTDPAYPDGLYWGVEYVAADGAAWNLDLWFLAEGTTQFDLEALKTLPRRLSSPEVRVAILRIKEAIAEETPRVRSYLVYDAVLEHGVHTIEDFRRYLADHSPT